jgi:hypothetical protein
VADKKTPVVCPKCGAKDSLVVAYSEHCDYCVTHLDVKDSYVDVDTDTRDNYNTELIHIHCNKCDTYWSNPGDMA